MNKNDLNGKLTNKHKKSQLSSHGVRLPHATVLPWGLVSLMLMSFLNSWKVLPPPQTLSPLSYLPDIPLLIRVWLTTQLKVPQAKVTNDLLASRSNGPTSLILLDFLDAFHIIVSSLLLETLSSPAFQHSILQWVPPACLSSLVAHWAHTQTSFSTFVVTQMTLLSDASP